MRNWFVVLVTLIAMVTSNTFNAAAQNRQERVDLLVLGGTIVTMDSARQVIDDGGIAVRAGESLLLDRERRLKRGTHRDKELMQLEN